MIYCMFPREPLVTNIMWRNLLIQVCVSLVASTYVTIEESSCHKLCVSVVCHVNVSINVDWEISGSISSKRPSCT
jgi:hypothetical protein